MTLQTQYADPSAAAYITAVAAALEARTLPADTPEAAAIATKAEDVELATALVQAADHLNSRAVLPVGVLLTQELGSAELFSLIQALQRPLKASFCLRVSMRLGDILQFGPATEVGWTFDALPRFRHEPALRPTPRNPEDASARAALDADVEAAAKARAKAAKPKAGPT